MEFAIRLYFALVCEFIKRYYPIALGIGFIFLSGYLTGVYTR